MLAQRRSMLLLGGLAGVIVLAIAGTMLYGAKKTRDLETSAAESVADATARLRESAGLALEAPQTAAALDAHAAVLEQRLARLRAEDAGRNRLLAEAAELYLIDVHAIVRNRANAARALAATRAARRALAAHLDAAAGRGQGWIQQALNLKARAERSYFDLRNALGTLAGLVDAHRESQAKLKAAAPQSPLLAEEERLALYKAAQEAQKQAEADLERLRQLPIG
jgi:hypothetical protein